MNNSNTFITKLRDSGLRPTKQRIKICQLLFKSKKTFHFTINDLAILIKKNLTQKVSLATIYNTVHAFKKKGYLKEISINSEKTYFDTNTSNHHHFIDESTNKNGYYELVTVMCLHFVFISIIILNFELVQSNYIFTYCV